jgi:predicted nucleic acid-binding Zn ribbon protein
LLHLRSRRRPVTGPAPSAAELTALREQIKQLDGQEDSPR